MCILLPGKFYNPELSVSGYLAKFTIRASLMKKTDLHNAFWTYAANVHVLPEKQSEVLPPPAVGYRSDGSN